MPTRLSQNCFVRPSGDPPTVLTLSELVQKLEAHDGLFVVENKEYDSLLYTGNDNLYFSYCFNFKTGRAIEETLLIVDTIEEYYNSHFVVSSQGKEHSIFLKA